MAKGYKTGGRTSGTPNKENSPIKQFLREHSIDYFTPSVQQLDDDGKPTGRIISEFDRDIETLEPHARLDVEIRLLEYHTPKQKAVEVDASATIAAPSLEAQLRALLGDDADI